MTVGKQDLLVLSHADVEACLPMAECIEAMRRALLAVEDLVPFTVR